MFVDIVKVRINAGDGGNGKLSFRHEKYVEKGGPDGGDGGNGGSIIFKASNNKNTLAEFRYNKLIKAEDGADGDKRRKHGKSGKNLVVDVPVGTVIYNNITGKVIADLKELEQQEVIAAGGRGGFGNAHFKSSIRQAPRLAEKGEKGDSLEATLEMRMVADVGIIGLPNAGKSTFLSVVSSARPEIGNYAFTTTVPNLGVADIAGESLLLADIPGLIEGASKGKGLGHEFLRHVSRCKVLLHLIDSTQDDVAAVYNTVNKELASYSKDLAKKPQILAFTKADLVDKEILTMQKEQLKPHLKRNAKVFAISSSAHKGTKELLNDVYKKVSELKIKEKAIYKDSLPVIILEPNPDDWRVSLKKPGVFLVTGSKIEGFAKRTDYNQPQAILRLRDILRKMGIMNELVKLGAEPGNKIVIGDPKAGQIEF